MAKASERPQDRDKPSSKPSTETRSSTASDRADQPIKKRRRKRAAQPEPTPILSGRLMVATIMLGAMAMIPFMGIGRALEPDAPAPTDVGDWRIGKTATVHVTLITADYNKLSCQSEQTFDGYHCQFETETRAFKRDPKQPLDDNKNMLIQPYRTHGSNKLIFIAGLWATPALATRLHFEPPRGVAESKLARFVAECEVEFIGQMKSPGIRWSPSGKWIKEGDPLVAIPKTCRIPDPDKV